MLSRIISPVIFSGATIYKKDAIKSFRFNEDLGIYSYLEDLFFSYSLSKKGFKLLICKNAKLFKSYLQPFGASVNNEML